MTCFVSRYSLRRPMVLLLSRVSISIRVSPVLGLCSWGMHRVMLNRRPTRTIQGSIPAAGKRYYGGTYKATTKELSESPVRIPPDLRPGHRALSQRPTTGHRSRQFRPQSPPFTYIRELMSPS
ncbi:hypothetical protein CABS01_10134 [Colletotrichum abscissum]|uniref:uncharacterized protein n=1 Tax=Colletotrichum abscissum TaxID=1671311 RepID=UPI0027D54F73|nr:uncharacterized protein CABS01_10134 [Colletotrichum abscissum]KAK1500410.1 hypothetical protein CABS01_10134 [Colletotrichum abscissum]